MMLKIQNLTRENINSFDLSDVANGGVRFRDVDGRFLILQESLRLRPNGSSVVCYLIHHYSARLIDFGRYENTDDFPTLISARCALLGALESKAEFARDMSETDPAEESMSAYCDAYEACYAV